jgi:membrane protein implicated in regulation of membrane protease activity
LPGPNLAWQHQIVAFVVLSAIAVALRLRGKRESIVNIGTSRLVGERGTLETAIENGHGQLRLGDTVCRSKARICRPERM